MSRDKIAVIIPCYNEALTIGKVIDDFRRELPEASVYVYDKDNAVTSLDEKKNATLNNALLKASTRIRLISKRELEDVAKITLDGELVEWRQGGELVNGVKFFSQELLYFSNGRSASITERACKISQFIKNANPELPDEIIAGWMGLPPTVLETMKRDQLRNDQVSEQDD